uniref:Uncharacterized protein n=1 Tax=Arundo donax TaxID=35708 RepID=A0A0A8YHZ9_ARUDO
MRLSRVMLLVSSACATASEKNRRGDVDGQGL